MIVGRIFFVNTFYTCKTILECNVKIKQTSDYYVAQKSPEYMEGLFFWVLNCLADHGGGGGGGGLVLLSFYACHLCVSLIVAILNFR